jgi:hypothetical protein
VPADKPGDPEWKPLSSDAQLMRNDLPFLACRPPLSCSVAITLGF